MKPETDLASQALRAFRGDDSAAMERAASAVLQAGSQSGDPWMAAVGKLVMARAVHRLRMDQDGALVLLEVAFPVLAEQFPDTTAFAFCCLELANQRRVRGDCPRASTLIDLAAQVIEPAPENPWDLAFLRFQQGTLAHHQGRRRKARKVLLDAAALFEAIPGMRLTAARVLNNLGMVELDSWNIELALDHFQRSLAIKEELEPGSYSASITLANCSTCLARMGRHAEALEQAAVNEKFWSEHDPGSWDHAIALHLVGSAFEAAGRMNEAAMAYRQGWDHMQLRSREVIDDSARIGFASTNFDTGLRLAACLALSEGAAPALRAAEEVRAFSLRAAVDHEEVTDEVRPLLEEHASVAAELLRLLERPGSRQSEFAAFELRRTALEAQLRSSAGAQRDVSMAVPAGWGFITWLVGDFFTVCIYSGPDGELKAERLPVRSRDWVKLLSSGRAPWLGPASADAWTSWTSEVAQALAPAAAWADLAGAEGLLIVPDGVLWSIPFAALPGPGGPVGLSLPLVVTRSLSLLQDLAASPARGSGVAAAGIREAHPGWRPLPLAEREAHEAVAAYGGGQVLAGNAAGRAAVLSALGAAKVVHVAAHGDIDNERALASALLLARGERLEAADIMGSGVACDLVALSACSSAKGSLMECEGFVGLAYALHKAGAKRVLASLWPVVDEEAREFMAAFYASHAGGLSASCALREAMKQSAGSGRLPTAWAAWTLSGLP